jgi:hypothetical protein
VPINHVTYKPSKIVIGYGSAILAAGLFGSVSTLAKPVLSTVNPIVLSSLVYLIAGFTFTPLEQQAGFTKQTNKQILLSHFDKCNTGRDYYPGNVLFGT